MKTVLSLALFATLFALVCCQDTPIPDPAVLQCVDQAATQDTVLQQCLQHFMNRQQNATSLAVYCGTDCVSVVETAYITCNSQNPNIVTKDCDGPFIQSLVNAEFCVSKAVSASSSLQNCQRQFLDIVFEDPQSTSVGPVCSNCGSSLGGLYASCGPAVVLSSRLFFGPTITELFQEGCAQDSMGHYCSDVTRGLAQPNRTQLEEAAVLACENIGNVCPQSCRDAINALGCCVHFEQLFRGPNDPRLPVDLCNIDECPLPFSIDPSTSDPNVCNAGLTVSFPLVVMTVSVLLSATLNIIFS